MAYYINGKAFTDNPLMDEIVYNCKLILNGIVVKNDVLANNSETENSINNAEMLYLQIETGTDISFDLFVFSEEILEAYGYSEIDARVYAQDKYRIPVEDRADLTSFANQYFRDNFVEENNYYRMLNGQPPFDTGDEYFIWLTSDDIPSNYNGEVDLSIPLHEQSRELINALYVDGIIDELRKTYPGSNYSYMNYLGEKQIDIYKARKAGKWDILYMPNVYYLIEDRFTDFYLINRETYINRSYQDYFSDTGEYYDQMMIIVLLAQTFADMVVDTPQWYIRRDIFDIKSCKYFLESNGVAYFKFIPLKYQIRIVKNLNRLITNKSSNQNIEDILDVFKIDNTFIYKYWLYKNGDELQFISSDYRESYDNYIKDTKYRTPYDTITLYDKYWDGEFDHNDVKDQILDQNFTIQGTKYMSVEYQIDLSEFMYQMEYMLGLILDSNLQGSLAEIRIGIPSINETAKFKLTDIFLFLVVLSNEYWQYNSNVIYPDDMSVGPEPPVNEKYYQWLKKTFGKVFVIKNGRINGFNSNLNKEELIDYIKSGRHSHKHLIFGNPDEIGEAPWSNDEYYDRAEEWIDELGLNDFIVPEYIYDIDTLIGTYKANTKVYEKVYKAITEAEDYNDKKVLEYIFQELFTRDYDVNFYKYTDESGNIRTYTSLIDMIKNRDYILYEVYLTLTTETNIESKCDMLRNIMNDIVDTMEYYIADEDGLEYLYSFVAINSPGSIVSYLYAMLNFFKSYKVYFLDPYYTLVADDKLENSVKPIDAINEYRIETTDWEKAYAADYVIALHLELSILDHYDHDIYEVADLYGHYDPDPLADKDFNGIHAEDGEEVTEELDGGTAMDSSQYPYIEANGGPAYLSMPDFENVNGGEADEFDRDYYEVDGGPAYDPDFMKTDAMGSQQFNYELDGGTSNKRRFITNSMEINLVGTEFVAEVIISDRDTMIEVAGDGLYVASDAMATLTAFNDLKRIFNEMIFDVQTQMNGIYYTLLLINPETCRANVQSTVNNVTADMEYANKMNTNHYFENLLYNHVNALVTCLNNEFPDDVLNPYRIEAI